MVSALSKNQTGHPRELLLVFDHQDADALPGRRGWTSRQCLRSAAAIAGAWELQAEGGTPTRPGIKLDRAAVTLDDGEHLRQAEARATLTLGSEERVEDPRLNVGRHAHPRIADLHDHVVVLASGAELDDATAGQGVHRVEYQVGDGFAQRCWRAVDGAVRLRVDHQVDRPPLRLGGVAPARRSQPGDVLQDLAKIDTLLFDQQLLRANERQQPAQHLPALDGRLRRDTHHLAHPCDVWGIARELL